jgi:hypothetical protein
LQGLYQQTFFDVNTRIGPERRYVWLNMDIDMVDIGASEFRDFESIQSAVKRLKFERENSNEAFYHAESRDLLKFVSVEELHIVCADGFWMWSEALDEHAWPCADDKLVFIDALDGRVARGLEFEALCKQMLDRAFSLTTSPTGEEWPSFDSRMS